MKKNDIVDYVLDNTNLSRSQAIAATDSVIEAISNSLVKGESVFIRGFASFKAIRVAAKRARNIAAGIDIIVPEHNSVKFKLSNTLKYQMNDNEW